MNTLIKLITLITFLIMTKYAFTATSGSIILRGNVPRVLSVSIVSNGSTSLDLGSTQNDLIIGYVNSLSNSSLGYKITFDSLNNGKLLNGTAFVAYSLKYDSTLLDLNGLSEINKSVIGLESKPLKISYIGVDLESIEAGDYEDVVTVSVVAN